MIFGVDHELLILCKAIIQAIFVIMYTEDPVGWNSMGIW